MKIRSSLAVLLATCTAVTASAELSNEEVFGTCSVVTEIDEFTDEVTHILACWEGQRMLVAACFEDGRRRVGFSRGASHFKEQGDRLRVRYRFDKGEVFDQNWIALSSDLAVSEQPQDVAYFVQELHGADTVAFEIDGERERITLSEANTVGAINELIERCREEEEAESSAWLSAAGGRGAVLRGAPWCLTRDMGGWPA